MKYSSKLKPHYGQVIVVFTSSKKGSTRAKKQKLEVYLEGQFGSYFAGDLVDDLGVKAATVVHVSNHDWKKLNINRGHVTVQTCPCQVLQMRVRVVLLEHTSAGPICFNPTYVAPNL